MTFLGWMHRKLIHTSTEPMKNSTLGNPGTCLSVQTLFDEQNYHVEPNKTLSRLNINCQKSPKGFDINQVNLVFQEESFEHFEFLSIGTFGMELPNTDPPTPTLAVPPENLTNQQMEVTENDLMQISYELEKFFEAEEKDIANDTSGRSSQASIITLNNKPIDGVNSEGHKYCLDYPLQNYLFGTLIDVSEPNKEVKKEKTSLEDLFKRTTMSHDESTRISSGAEQPPKKRSVVHFMKKMVKKFPFSLSSSMASSKYETTTSIPMKKKLSKALKMLHRKVHPEEMTQKQFVKIQEREKKGLPHKDAWVGENENEMVGQAVSKKREKNTTKLSSNIICKGAFTTNGGHWIKTDSEYLVLEL